MDTSYINPETATVPSFIGGSTARIAAGASSNVTLPAGLQQGDGVFVLVGCDNVLDGSTDGILSPGYKKLDLAPAGTTPGSHFAYKIMGATPDATVRVKADPNREAVVAIHAWRNVAPDDYTPAVRVASAGSGMPNPPSASSSVPDSVHLIGGVLDDKSMTPTAPSGFGNLVSRGGKGAAGTSATAMLASRLLATPGTVDPAAFGGAHNDCWRAYHLVLPPVSGTSGAAAETLSPPQAMGYGAKVTGGRGGKFVRVTSLSDSASTVGSLRWAFGQHPGSPLYIAVCVEGNIPLGSILNITRPNWTLDFRYAPGSGCWLTGKRIEIERSNFILDSAVHLGNDPSPSGNSDCIRIGDFGGSNDVNGGYIRRCEFKHGGDEVFAFTPRKNGQSTGPRVTNFTIEDCIIADPTSTSQSDHHFLFFVGDGCERITVHRNLLSTGLGRFPLFKEHSSYIEWFNNAAYNANPNTVNTSGMAKVDFIGNLIRLGNLWSDANGPISVDGTNDFYESGTLVDSKVGKTSSHKNGLYETNLPKRLSRFSPTSGLVPVSASQVEALISENCGPRVYGGARHARTQATINEFLAGNAPTSLAKHPGPTRTATGATYGATNANGVPLAYIAEYPSDSNPEIIISGGAWDGHMVAERIGAWHVRKVV